MRVNRPLPVRTAASNDPQTSRLVALSGHRAGTAALELAIAAPIFVLLLLGMIAFGLYFMYLHELQELASSAARASVSGLSQSERNSLALQFVSNSVSQSIILNASDVSVSTMTSGSPATNYSVTVSYDLKDTPIPMLAQMISMQFSNITRTSTIEFGGY